MTEAARLRPGLVHGRIQMCGGGAGCLCLCGQLLRLAKFGDRGGQRNKLTHQRYRGQRHVTCQVPGQSDHPGGAA